MTAKRKLAVILCADVAGYSRLMAADDTQTLRALNESRMVYRNRVKSHDGNVIDTAGDSILAEFSSPVEAVRCALDIQNDLSLRNAELPEQRRMLFRIGINLGDVIAENAGLYGDGVNVAARLQELSEPGGLCISGSVFDQVEGKVDAVFAWAGEQQVKNIPRPVRTYQWTRETAGNSFSLLAMPSGLSVAVLPFTNLGGDPGEDYFSDGLTEDVITELSRFRELHVLARNTTFQYKGQSVDIPALGRKLGAHYVLEGSVRRAGNRVRINAQLIDVATGTHCWAERFDREIADVFAVQDEITGKIVGTMAGGWSSILGNVHRAATQRKRPADLTAYDLVLQAEGTSAFDRDGYARTAALLKQAMDLDPTYARPRHQYAWLLIRGWIFRFEASAKPPEMVNANAIASVQLDPADALAHRTAAYGYFFDHQLDLFEREVRLAFELAPYNAEIFAQLGMAVTFTGQWERGVALVRKAFALNEASAGGWYHSALYYDFYRRGKYREALEIIRQHPFQDLTETRWKYIAAYGELGEIDEAREWWRLSVAGEPQFSTDWVRRTLRRWNFPEPFLSRYMDGFVKAGYPPQGEE
jgi:TolB-like protein